MTHEQKAREILNALSKEHGDETFVADGYAYHDDALERFAAALRDVEERTLERAAKYIDAQGCIHRMEDETTWAALADSYAAKIRKLKEPPTQAKT